jgi:hypothetical protein
MLEQRLTSNKLYVEYASLTVVWVDGGEVPGGKDDAESLRESTILEVVTDQCRP